MNNCPDCNGNLYAEVYYLDKEEKHKEYLIYSCKTCNMSYYELQSEDVDELVKLIDDDFFK